MKMSKKRNLSDYDKTSLPDATAYKFGIVVSEWNEEVTEGMYEGAKQTLLENGVPQDQIVRWNVPGSFELIYGCKRMQQTIDTLDAIIAIGCVVQGETRHFDFVSEAVALGIKDLNVHSNIPVIFCVLTYNTYQQSLDSSRGKHGEKGTEAAVAAIKMADLR